MIINVQTKRETRNINSLSLSTLYLNINYHQLSINYFINFFHNLFR